MRVLKISTKGRYGLRAIVDLVVNSKGDHVPLINIAERQNLSKNYLEQVFATLRKAGIVKSVKGAQGGYALAKNPSAITVCDILKALEGELSVISYSGEIEMKGIEKSIKKNLWDTIDEAIYKIINEMTLEDLVNDYYKDHNSLMYYI